MDQVVVKTEETGPLAPGQTVPEGDVQAKAADAPQQENQDRPEWLPENFKSPQELVEAYRAATAENKPAPEAQATPDEAAATEKLSKFSQEFFSKGTLSEDSYKELSKMGYPKTVVDQFIAGQKAVMAAEEQQVYSAVGGAENYQSLVQWAGQNLSKEEVSAYNHAVETGDMNQIMFAVKGLQARYAAAGRSEPKLMQGTGKTTSGAFKSVAEVVAAMSDPKYKVDPAYRAEVEKKLANSNVL